VTGWIYIGGMLFGAASSGPSAAYYACLVISEYTGIPNTPLLGATVTTLVILAAWWTAFKDMKLSGDVMIVIEVTSLSVMFAIIAIAMSRNGPWIDRPQLTLQGAGPRAFSAGLVLCFLTMAGFESATTLGEESRNAVRSIPRAIMGCVVPIGLLYLVMTYLLVGLGRKFGIALDQLETPFDTLAKANHLSLLGTLSSVGVALSYFACTLGSINAGSRALYSMSEDGYFFRPFGRAHPVNATPHRAIALIGLISIAVPLVMLCCGTGLYSVIDLVSQLAALGFHRGLLHGLPRRPDFPEADGQPYLARRRRLRRRPYPPVRRHGSERLSRAAGARLLPAVHLRRDSGRGHPPLVEGAPAV